MDWYIDRNRPICPQICEQLCLRIAKGTFAPHEKLLSVREIAVAAGVNPNTVQRSLETLEQSGILYSVRGSGWFVSGDTSPAKQILADLITQKTADYFLNMQHLGMDSATVKEYVKEWNL